MMHANWISALANHLWQSTLFVLVAWMLAFALRKNQASTRYWIWLTASLKFMMPFALLIEVGKYMGAMFALHASKPIVSQVVERVTQPFPQTELLSTAIPAATLHNAGFWPAAAASVWAAGVLIFACIWALKWWQLHAAVQMASRHALDAAVPVLSSQSLVEPGVFGIVEPVLLLPEGIANHLTQAQFEAILAHEMCHVRRRDNLTFAMHMAVETIFWFHPLIWWIRTRLIEERERACDEAVLQSGNNAEVYAEGILNVCKFYIESPLACASGVTGSDLKQRIVRIMTGRLGNNLSIGGKLLLSAVAAVAIVMPLVFGLGHTTQIFAQTRVEDSSVDLPQFEVVSIKPNKSDDNRTGFLLSKGGFSLTGVPLQMMLREAFDVNNSRIFGSPNWANTDRFNVEAKVSEADLPKLDNLAPEQRVKMLLPVLQDRFNLKYHHETREMTVYVLTVAKGGLKLKEAPVQTGEKHGGVRMNGLGDFQGENVKIEFLGHVLSEQPELGHTILDKTGLTGSYDFHLQWTPAQTGPIGPDNSASGSSAAPDTNKPDLFTALQEQLGLKLESQKGPVDVIVIDHIEKPSAN
jgi:bla regulator protein blaR1